MISFLSIIAVGFFLGMRHATDPDHVIAVTTIVSRQRNLLKAALTGIFWGIGHTFTIFVVGTAIILFDVVIPARIGLSMEFSVGLMLIVLGGMNIASFMRTARTIAPPGKNLTWFILIPTFMATLCTTMLIATVRKPIRTSIRTPLTLLGPVVWQDRSLPTVAPVGRGIVHGLAGSAAGCAPHSHHHPQSALGNCLPPRLRSRHGWRNDANTMSIASAFKFFGKRTKNFLIGWDWLRAY